MILYLLVSLLMCGSVLQAEVLPLPSSVANKAVNYIKAHQVDDFSCSYNALFNGCNLEKLCEFQNPYSDYTQFKSVCQQFITQKNQRRDKKYTMDPKGSAYNDAIEELGLQRLRMQPIVHLGFNEDNVIQVLFSTPTEISFWGNPSKEERAQMWKKAFEKRTKECISDVKAKVARSTKRSEIVHFICGVKIKGMGHAILVTLVQNYSGRALYILDNMNGKIDSNSQIIRYINYLCSIFDIGQKNQVKALKIPDVWPSTPQRVSRVQKIVRYYSSSPFLYQSSGIAVA